VVVLDAMWWRFVHASTAVWCIRAAVLLGATLRIRNWAHDASLWLDEIAVSNSILSRGFAGLTKPLAGEQAAPIGWLWLVHLATRLFGHSELALRLVPMLSSLVALVAVAVLARMVLGAIGAAVTTLLFAVSPFMIFYAADVKQYSMDTAAVALVLLATVWAGRQKPSSAQLGTWAAVAAVLSWLSFPAAPIALLCGAVIAVRWLRTWTDLAWFTLAGLAVGGSVLAEYVVTLRHLAADRALDNYWRQVGGYPSRGGSKLVWVRHAVPAVIRNPIGITWPILALVLGVIGFIVVARTRPTIAVILALPVLAALGMAVTYHYPMYQRLAVYVVPSAVLFVAASATGAACLARDLIAGRVISPTRAPAVWAPRAATAVTSVLLVIATAHSVASGLDKLGRPDEVEAGREAMRFIANHKQPGDLVIYDNPWSGGQLRYYGRKVGVTANGWFAAARCRGDRLAPIQRQNRVWLFFGHRGSVQPKDRAAVFASHFAQHGTVLESWTGPGQAAAYLLDFSTPPVDPTPPMPMWASNLCVRVTIYS
jgi:hypothetical protein